MKARVARREGQPVLFLGLLLAGWCLLRVLTWESPWPQGLALPDPLRFADIGAQIDYRSNEEPEPANESHPGNVHSPSVWITPPAPPALFGDQERPGKGLKMTSEYAEHFATDRRAVGHNLLFAAGMASLPMPRSVAALLDQAEARDRSVAIGRFGPGASPWRFDGWLVLRDGGTQLTGTGERPASYGASQVGAVLAFRLDPDNAHAPAAYVRASRALIEGGETEGAVGVRVRPMAGLPVSLHAEARLTQRPGRPVELRPAAFVAGGFEGLSLPQGLTARGYGQAGYAGGEFSTPFADGALVVEREVARFDLGEVSLGAGAWGGAQRGATRLDLGPRLAVKIEVGGAPARIEADYRWRVAGQAQPGNGGVLTLSTGF